MSGGCGRRQVRGLSNISLTLFEEGLGHISAPNQRPVLWHLPIFSGPQFLHPLCGNSYSHPDGCCEVKGSELSAALISGASQGKRLGEKC